MDPLVPLSYVNQLANTTVNYGLIGVIVILVFSGAFFSGVETALTCCNRARMKTKADDGYKSAKLVTRILNKYDQSLIMYPERDSVVRIDNYMISGPKIKKMHLKHKYRGTTK